MALYINSKVIKILFPSINQFNPDLIRKDLNFQKDVQFLQISDPDLFVHVIERDSEFFEDLNLMDYSMLVYRLKLSDQTLIGLENSKDWKYYKKNFYLIDEYDEENKRTAFCFTIIDYLQDYNFSKNIEYIYKNFINFKKRLTDGFVDVSCVPPDRYSKRFVDFFKGMLKNANNQESLN